MTADSGFWRVPLASFIAEGFALSLAEAAAVRRLPMRGVYAFRRGGVWLYVGQSADMWRRVIVSWRERVGAQEAACELFVAAVPSGDLLAAEAVLIRRLRPLYNVALTALPEEWPGGVLRRVCELRPVAEPSRRWSGFEEAFVARLHAQEQEQFRRAKEAEVKRSAARVASAKQDAKRIKARLAERDAKRSAALFRPIEPGYLRKARLRAQRAARQSSRGA